MARKGESYKQVPTLWYLGYGYPCRVMRRRRVNINGKWRIRWENFEHDVLTTATMRRWLRLAQQGCAQVRRDTALEAFMQVGIVPIPKRKEWAR